MGRMVVSQRDNMSMELLGDVNVLSIAFIAGFVAHFVIQKFKSFSSMVKFEQLKGTEQLPSLKLVLKKAVK